VVHCGPVPRRPPLCLARHPPQSVAAWLSRAARRSSPRMGTKSRETIYGASGRRQNRRRKRARPLTVWPSRRGTSSACSAFRVRGSHRPRSVTHSMRAVAISKRNALAATRTAPWRSTSCGDRRRHRSTNLNATCGARTARRFAAMLQAQPSCGAARAKISTNDPPSTWWPGER
jgi:hypothetical protein